MNLNLTGRVALVTGGTGGIGTTICQLLASEGCKVATNYRSEEKAAVLREAMSANGHEVGTYLYPRGWAAGDELALDRVMEERHRPGMPGPERPR